ncbi:MAG TPA: hypothetical protein VGM20_00250 [Gemmatimonadales bacterium]|jgi:hypothetical protein
MIARIAAALAVLVPCALGAQTIAPGRMQPLMQSNLCNFGCATFQMGDNGPKFDGCQENTGTDTTFKACTSNTDAGCSLSNCHVATLTMSDGVVLAAAPACQLDHAVAVALQTSRSAGGDPDWSVTVSTTFARRTQ